MAFSKGHVSRKGSYDVMQIGQAQQIVATKSTAMANEAQAAVTIGSLMNSGAIIGHKDGNYGSFYPRAEEFGAEGIPFLTAKSLNNGRIDIEGAPRLSERRANELPFGFVVPGDVLLSHNATIGRVAVVPEFTGRLLIGTSLTYFRLDTTRLWPRYLAAYFSGTNFQHQLAAVMSHSTRNQVPVTAQRGLKIVVPPLAEQIAIANVLGIFDEKIELNRLMNETLENMARALFKSWFVDFDPVRAKAEGRELEGMDAATAALFPSGFQESLLGPIPSGWRVATVAQMCERIVNGGTPSRTKPDYWAGGTIPWFKTGELSDGHLLSATEMVTQSAIPETSTKILPRHSILMAIYAAPTVGRLGILCQPSAFNQACTGMTALPFIGPWFLYQTLLTGRAWFNNRANGAAQQNISKAIVESYQAVLPTMPLLSEFNSLVRPLYSKMESSKMESQVLSDLRDTLLPRLISGKVRVPEAEQMVEAVL